MKYEAEIDLRNENTSHALLVELVGRDQRVLDVGCAGGDLGKILKRRGCTVSGVELDRTAAQAAEHVLDEVLTGDVSSLDLVEHFGKARFDVVVFGDVLEHLADPVAVLRKVRPLLAESGSVVASIPNVAHGSVRLSLLNGQFDYRPLGLLDSTHLRFFTRGSLHETFREAGLVPVDMRRTTVGIFDTEIGVRREDFDQGIVDAIEGDPDSTTYQFVLRSVPEESRDATDTRPTLPRPADRCRIGIWTSGEPEDIPAALTMRVTYAELSRRLPGTAIRSFSSSEVRTSPHDGGLAVEPLGPWSPERASQLASELDCIVIAGTLPEPGDGEVDDGRHPARFLLEGLGPDMELECPVLRSAVRRGEASLDGVPDPLLLVARLMRSEALIRRLEFVRLMGWFPWSSPAVVVEMSGGLLEHAEVVARALDLAVAGSEASVVLVHTDPRDADGNRAADIISDSMATSVYRVPADVLADDLVTVIASAAVFAPCSASGTALGLAYERPMAYVAFASDPSVSQLAAATGCLGAVVTKPSELAHLLDGERFRPVVGMLDKLQSKLDAHFDQVAAIADRAAAGRPRTHGGRVVLAPPEFMAAVQLAHRRMQERLDAERRAVADHLGDLRSRHDAEVAVVRNERDSIEAELWNRLNKVNFELEALRGIRVLRMLRPARAVYARLRGRRL